MGLKWWNSSTLKNNNFNYGEYATINKTEWQKIK